MDHITLSFRDLISLIGAVAGIGIAIGGLTVLAHRVKTIETVLWKHPDGIESRLSAIHDWMIKCKAICPALKTSDGRERSE